MTLLIAVLCASVTTILWYISARARTLKIGTLALMYWGASLMWLCDAVFGFLSEGAAFFAPGAEQMLNDTFLGLSAAALGLVIWLAVVLVKDPNGVLRGALSKRR